MSASGCNSYEASKYPLKDVRARIDIKSLSVLQYQPGKSLLGVWW